MIIAIFTGIVGSEISNGQKLSSSNLLKTSVVIIVIISILDFILAILYFKREEDLNEKQSQIDEKNNIIEQQAQKLSYLLGAFDELGIEFMRSSEKMYQVITNAKENGEIKLDAWSKNEIFSFVCDSLHDYICKIAETGNDFSVSIIVRNKTNRNNILIFTFRLIGNCKIENSFFGHRMNVFCHNVCYCHSSLK